MMRVLLLPVAVCSCATSTPRSGTTASWCSLGEARRADRQVEDAEVTPVRPNRLAATIEALGTATVLPLDRTRAQDLAGGRLAERRNYYAVRSGLYAPQGATPKQLHRAAAGATFLLWQSNGGEALVSTFQMSVPAPVTTHKLAVIVATDAAISQAVVGCYAEVTR
jgi:hypothetical protein